MQNKFFRFVFFFLVFLLFFQWLSRSPQQKASDLTEDVVIASDSPFVIGDPVLINLKNNSDGSVQVSPYCEGANLKVSFYQNGEWLGQSENIGGENCSSRNTTIESGSLGLIDFGQYNYDLFGRVGLYRIDYDVEINDKLKQYTHQIEVVNPSFIKLLWREFLYKPIYNTLIFFLNKIPGHHLGWAIILLTFIIKLILLVPNQKALKSQRKLQKVQPQLDALRQKYKNDPQRLAQETMQIWQKHKVSPMGSCLPMLIQFPILIALFYVVKNGLQITNPELLYEPLRHFKVEVVNFMFLGVLDLAKNSLIVLPLIVAGLQFTQIKLSFSRIQPSAKSNPMMGMNQVMQYFMPIMIAVFTASLPAAVGLYWGTSTLFSVGQQLVVNLSKD